MATDSLRINEAKEALFPLKRNKSPGYNEISFKNCLSKLNIPLKYLFQIFLESEIFLNKLKIARVIPLSLKLYDNLSRNS